MQLGTSKPARVPGRVPITVWYGVLFIVVATLLAYWPVYSAGFIWDDDLHIIDNPSLRDFKGLVTIWFDPKHNPQYYPLVFSSFWLEFHLWGLNPHGFHMVNVALQIVVALLLWRVLAGLQVPGAWLAAAIFALHPVQVESVAWITERKNVLSAVFYLAAALAYLRFAGLDGAVATGPERKRYYWVALALFVAALWSKTVTCSLPAVLALVIWWKTGRLGRRDILPLLPFFGVGLLLGLQTAWLEKTQVGASGAEWSLTFLERSLIAGRVLWFYAVNLVCPLHLTFIYPRWVINPDIWWQWLFPIGAAGVVAGLWLARHRIGRGPLVAVLFFAITLFPASGFINVYPMRFSFVADHFQYLACIGLLALAAARLGHYPKFVPGMVLALCGLLTWNQCAIYQDLPTLWADTLAKNPACWMAHTNLGRLLAAQGQFPEAEAQYQASLAINNRVEDTHYNYGNLLARTDRLPEAMAQYQQALQLAPDRAVFHSNLGVVLLRLKHNDDAITEDRQAIAIDPAVMSYHYNLASALLAQSKTNEAVAEFQRALQLEPDSALVKRRLHALGVDVN